MKKLRLLVFSLCAIHKFVFAEDACQTEFVTCVQKSGNPAKCQSTYVNCKSAVGQDVVKKGILTDGDTGPLQFWTEFVQYESDFTAVRLYVSNPSDDLVQLSNSVYKVICADGSTEQAVFVMTGQVAGHTKRQVAGADQFVCMAAGGPNRVEEHNNSLSVDDGMMSYQSKLDLEVPCGDNQNSFITVTYERNRIFRWKNSSGVKGVLTKKIVEKDDFARRACDSMSHLDGALLKSMRKQLIELLNWMSSDEKPQSQVIFLNNRSSAIGVRG